MVSNKYPDKQLKYDEAYKQNNNNLVSHKYNPDIQQQQLSASPSFYVQSSYDMIDFINQFENVNQNQIKNNENIDDYQNNEQQYSPSLASYNNTIQNQQSIQFIHSLPSVQLYDNNNQHQKYQNHHQNDQNDHQSHPYNNNFNKNPNKSNFFKPSIQQLSTQINSLAKQVQHYQKQYIKMKAINQAIILAITNVLDQNVGEELNKYMKINMDRINENDEENNRYDSDNQTINQLESTNKYEKQLYQSQQQFNSKQLSKQMSKQIEKILITSKHHINHYKQTDIINNNNKSILSDHSKSPKSVNLSKLSHSINSNNNKNNNNNSNIKQSKYSNDLYDSGMTFVLTPSKSKLSYKNDQQNQNSQGNKNIFLLDNEFFKKYHNKMNKNNNKNQINFNMNKISHDDNDDNDDNISTNRTNRTTDKKVYCNRSNNDNENSHNLIASELKCNQCNNVFSPTDFIRHMLQKHKLFGNKNVQTLNQYKSNSHPNQQSHPSLSSSAHQSSISSLQSSKQLLNYTIVLENLSIMREQIQCQIGLLTKSKQKINKQKLKKKLEEELDKVNRIIQQKQQQMIGKINEQNLNSRKIQNKQFTNEKYQINYKQNYKHSHNYQSQLRKSMKKNKNIHKNTLNQSYNSQNNSQSTLNIQQKNDNKSKKSNNTSMNMIIKNK